MKKTLQYFSKEYLAESKKFSPEEIVEFIEGFRELQASISVQQKPVEPSILISMKVPKLLLESFKLKAKKQGTRYQTQIKLLMEKWLREG